MNIGDGEFNCTCTEGFDGERCQSDECDPDPCLNGATCVVSGLGLDAIIFTRSGLLLHIWYPDAIVVQDTINPVEM